MNYFSMQALYVDFYLHDVVCFEHRKYFKSIFFKKNYYRSFSISWSVFPRNLYVTDTIFFLIRHMLECVDCLSNTKILVTFRLNDEWICVTKVYSFIVSASWLRSRSHAIEKSNVSVWLCKEAFIGSSFISWFDTWSWHGVEEWVDK